MGFPLQIDYQFFTETDPTLTAIVLGIFAAFVAFLVIWNALVSKGGDRRKSTPGKFSKFQFRRRAKKLGLARHHISALEQLVKEFHVANPYGLLQYQGSLDALLKKSVLVLENSSRPEAEKEDKKHLIYEMKQILEANMERGKTIPSTATLRLNTDVTIRTADGRSFQSRVTANLKNMLGLAQPDVSEALAKQSEVVITFLHNETDVFAFKTRILGFRKVRETPSLFVDHGRNLKQVQKRRSRRKTISRPAYFYRVSIVATGSGRKTKRQAVVNNTRPVLGSLQDLSAGGCAISAQSSLPRGSLIKVDFETAKKTMVTAYGKVRHVSSVPYRGKVMHVMFTGVTKHNLNKIRDYVYGFAALD